MMEMDIIKKFEKSGDITSWCRFADDISCVVKIGSFGKIYKKINFWDGNLFFTFERMSENRLTFPNCKIFIENIV